MEARPRDSISLPIEYIGNIWGLITQLEEREAARFNNYSWSEWQALPYGEKVMAVAFTQVQHQIELLSNDAVQDEIRRKTKAK